MLEQNNLFPVFLKLDSLQTLIVGGGHVGLEKLTAVLKNSPSAKVTLVARSIQEPIKDLARTHSGVELFERDL
jgi:siroheme synthase (precorrin-2 oxidase/ferrochelatase)